VPLFDLEALKGHCKLSMSGSQVTDAARNALFKFKNRAIRSRTSIVPTEFSTQPEPVFLSRRRTAQDDIELQSIDLTTNDAKDYRTDDEHWSEDPHFIAGYLAQNTSKAAAVFRRYDRLVTYRLLLLNRELNSLEEEHYECIVDKRKESGKRESRTVGAYIW